jgi:hypothetical protein
MTTTTALPESPAEIESSLKQFDKREQAKRAEWDANIAKVHRAQAEDRTYHRKLAKFDGQRGKLDLLIPVEKVKASEIAIAKDEPDFSGFLIVRNLGAVRKNVADTAETLRQEIIPVHAITVATCQFDEAMAEAELIETVVEKRQFEMRIALAGVVALDGQVGITRDRGATAELERQAGQARLRAESFRDLITELQKKGAK